MAVNINCRKKDNMSLLARKDGKNCEQKKILPSALFSHDIAFYMYDVHLQMF
jgi:hypothetical protein